MARFRLPAGATSINVDGLDFEADADGGVEIDDSFRPQMLLAGCVEEGTDEDVAAAASSLDHMTVSSVIAEADRQIAELRGQLEAARTEPAGLRKDLERVTAEASAERERHTQVEGELRGQLEAARTEIERLTKQLEEAEAKKPKK